MARMIQEVLGKYDKDFAKNAHWYTLVTRPARNYIVFCKEVDGVERALNFTNEFINGYRTLCTRQIEVHYDKSRSVIWNFSIIVGKSKTGYMVSSYKDALGVQVSKETLIMLYELIMEKAKQYPDVRVEERDLW